MPPKRDGGKRKAPDDFQEKPTRASEPSLTSLNSVDAGILQEVKILVHYPRSLKANALDNASEARKTTCGNGLTAEEDPWTLTAVPSLMQYGISVASRRP